MGEKFGLNRQETVIYCARVEKSSGVPTRCLGTLSGNKTWILPSRKNQNVFLHICTLGAGHPMTRESS